MFEWVIDYIEPIIMLVIGYCFLRVWSATELKKKEIEEDGKAQRSKINCDSKDAQARYDLMSSVREMEGMADGEGDEMSQMMSLVGMLNPQENKVGEVAVINELEDFAKTEDGAKAMAQFNEFQNKKTGGMV